ncbi:terminase large subunit [Zhenhengia sp.]|uniref:terminase large subunit n=1 Tax=Zhenhengia sp. TaxID=2944208 RepID=UPI003991B5B0
MDYFFDYETADKIMNIMKLINFATGAVAGQSLYEACVGYQYFFVLNIFCWKRKDKPEKRRYEVCLLWIARKNSKSVGSSMIMIILMLLEPKYSEFYLCANTRDQARIVYNETKKLLESSPYIKDKFDIKRDIITCKLNQNTLKALSSEFNTTDGLRVSAACIDEVGAAKDGGLIESMTSGMLSVQNRLLILISTSYPNTQNPFLEWTDYSKKVIDGVVEDEKLFAMLYSLDEKDEMTVENFMKANPLQSTLEDGKEYLESEYKKALEMGGAKLTSFKCKHLNIWLDGMIGEIYIPTEEVRKCRLHEPFSWCGRQVYIGIDLAMTTDNCSVAMITEEGGKVYANVWAFIPADRIEEKTRVEKVDYQAMIRNGNCFACGENVVDYGFIESFILGLEKRYGVVIMGIGFDRYNCLSTAQKLETNGYETTEIKQHSSVLHSPTKLLEELVLTQHFGYERNRLLEINFANARCLYDTNLNRYVNKKKSTGKIDMVASLINAMYLLEKDMLQEDFVVQVF